MKIKSTILLILDGWGHAGSSGGNALTVANLPNYNRLLREYPHTILKASGQAVGLPGNEVGNSEVGHMNIGAGQIVRQDISRITDSIEDGSFYQNRVLLESLDYANRNNRKIHLIGIVSDGGIHSHVVHLYALLKLCQIKSAKDVIIHAITDGRDTDQYKGLEFLTQLNYVTDKLGVGKVGTVSGRIFLDRKGDFLKTEKIYRAIVEGVGEKAKSDLAAVSAAYKRGENDEYLSPTVIDGIDSKIAEGDVIIFFNFRSDRTRQLTAALLDPNFNKFKREKRENIDFISFIPYGIEKELGVEAKTAFPALTIQNTLAKAISDKNLKQFHIAETEKYAHVTYFFNGNHEDPYPGEERMIVPSPNVKSYAEKPEMSAQEVQKNLIKNMGRNTFSFIICNFANPDMVGHTGDFDAAVKAVEFLDLMLKDIVRTSLDLDHNLIITADHGNVEQMVDPLTGHPDPEHTRNPVPLIFVSSNKELKLKTNGILGNIAETCLYPLGPIPKSGFLESLIE